LASLTFVARNSAEAAIMAREFKGRATEWENVPDELKAVDVLVAATSARLTILSPDSVRRVTEGRQKQLLIVDAGVPRNVDPTVAELPDVRLLNLDSLTREQEEALAARQLEVARVEAILNKELRRWRFWWERRTVGASIEEHSPASHAARELTRVGQSRTDQGIYARTPRSAEEINCMPS